MADVPEDDSCRESEEFWLDGGARRLMVWGPVHPYFVAELPATELRAQIRRKGVAAEPDEYKASILRDFILSW